MTKDNGGPAFPCSVLNPTDDNITGYLGDVVLPNTTSFYRGMTLRDYFATHATEADIAEFLPVQYAQSRSNVGSGDWERHGYDSAFMQQQMQSKFTRQEAKFRYADAMIEARGK